MDCSWLLSNSFIEIAFTYHMVHSIPAYNSLDFYTFTRLSNHHLYLTSEHFITPKGNPVPSPAPDNHEPTPCVCGFACPGRFPSVESHTVCLSVSGFCH